MIQNNICKIGITGNIGSGKSSVSDYLISKGFTVIDADKIVKEIYNNKDFKSKMINEFGSIILDNDNNLDKRKIFEIVFSDSDKLSILDSIIMPFFEIEFYKSIENFDGDILFFDIPLMYEKEYDKLMDYVILVYCKDEIRYKRASIRDNKTIDMIKSVDNMQISQTIKREKADFIIDNSGDISKTYVQLEKILDSIIGNRWMVEL